MNTVRVQSAFKSYGIGEGHCAVLKNMNMNVSPGSIYGLIGSSGCGKTTLLSCILGMTCLDSGKIEIFGHDTDKTGVTKLATRIGYMPQETALVNELSVKETCFYFGNIFQMDMKKLKERYEMIKCLLELPCDDFLVENCSGGEKRRVSFAAAIIHEPDLLILDEPTVGLDPLLREKIWDFLVNVTRSTKLSVIITTHYIVEAQKSDRVGLMRNGALLKEDSPSHIMAVCGVNSLEEALLNCCLNKPQIESNIDEVIEVDREEMKSEKEEFPTNVLKRKRFRWQVVKALLTKHITHSRRQPAGIIMMAILPIFNVFICFMALGGNPIGLKLAVVNNEISSYNDCLDTSLTKAFITEESCVVEKYSCRFLHEIDDSIAIKKFYNSFEEAYKDAKDGKVTGIVEFKSNFSESIREVDFDFKSTEIGSLQNSIINVYLDQTDLQITTFLTRSIYSAYKSYSERLMESCELPTKLKNSPFTFQKPIYGKLNSDQTTFMVMVSIIQMAFFTGAGLTIIVFITDRREGFWNRSLVAGVKTSELLLAQAIAHSTFMTFYVAEMYITATLLMDLENQGSMALLILIGLMHACSGLVVGLLLSIYCPNMMVANAAMFGISNIIGPISGIFWPFEGFHVSLRYISIFSPFTLPTISLREVMTKGFNIFQPSVYQGLLVLLMWIILPTIFCFKALNTHKFSRNS